MTQQRPTHRAPNGAPPPQQRPPAPPPPFPPAGSGPADAVEDRRPSHHRRRTPHLSGDLPGLLDDGPVFARALHGYDRLQVDNYVAWAESELRAAERVSSELLTRLAASEGQVREARQLLARSPDDRQLGRISDRVAELLGLAAQEAALQARATTADAEQSREVVAHAYQEAEVVVRRARRLEAQAAARLEEAERRMSEARRTEEEARSTVQELLQAAAEEQERLEDAAAARLARATWELAELRHRAAGIRRRLSAQVDAALAVLTEETPAGYSFDANHAGAPADRETAARALGA